MSWIDKSLSEPWRLAVENRAKTHCPKGHPYAGENLITNAAGHRICRACKADIKRRYRENNRDKIRAAERHYRECNRWLLNRRAARYRERNREEIRRKAREANWWKKPRTRSTPPASRAT